MEFGMFVRKGFLTTIILFSSIIAINAQFFYDEPGTGSTGIFTLNGNAVYTGNGTLDPLNNGWIRLVNPDNFQFGYVVLDKTFPTNLGVTVEFDFKIWGSYGMGQADGFSVFLINGKSNAGAFQPGVAGGSLGFFNSTPTYMGVGIDEYGNFTTDNGGPGYNNTRQPNQIAVRAGSMPTNASYKYYYLTGTGPIASPSLTGPTANSPRPGDATYYRRVRIEFTPVGTGVNVKVGLKASTASPDYTTMLNYDYTSTNSGNIFIARPDTMRVGFAASTGSGGAYHEVRNVIIKTPGGFQIFKTLPEQLICLTKNTVTPITTVISSSAAAQNNILIKDTLPVGYDVTSGPVAGAGGSIVAGSITNKILPDGRPVYSYRININANATFRINYNGSFQTIPSGGVFDTSAEIDPANLVGDLPDVILYAKLTETLKYVDRLMPQNRIVPYYNGITTALSVTASSGATFSWRYSVDNGTTWTNSGVTASSYTPLSSMLNGQTVFVRCIANIGGCTDEVDYILVPYPENILNPNCYSKVTAQEWSFYEVPTNTAELAHNYISPLVGDIDGDGVIEIITASNTNASTPSGIYIHKGNDLSQAPVFMNTAVYGGKAGAPYGIVRYNNTAYLILASTDRRVYAYDLTTKTQKWVSSATDVYHSSISQVSPGFADFNADGIPEIYVGNSIYNITNGQRIATVPSGGNHGYYFIDGNYASRPIVADVDNDGVLEYVAGTEVYSVDVAAGQMKLKYKLNAGNFPSTTIPYQDGQTQVVDWDGDGQLDIVVSFTLTDGKIYFYIWNVKNHNSSGVVGEVMAYYASPAAISTNAAFSSIGVPMIGDLDGDKHPDMVFVTQLRLNILKHSDAAPGKLDYSYIASTDHSGFTGATLFDFDQDGHSELVYRDETQLRIMNFNGTTFVDKKTLPLYSATWAEYPVVADIDNDGAAEIVVVGGASATSNHVGRLHVYKSADPVQPWAPARKVWNQYHYNPLFVNEDLTIPSVPLNPAIKMSDGINVVQPFNNFLQQSTTLLQDGTPFRLTPHAQYDEQPTFTYHPDGDSLVINLKIKNDGDASFRSPFYISIYRKTATDSIYIKSDSIMQDIAAGAIVHKSITVKNMLNYNEGDFFIIMLNNKNSKNSYIQLQCNYAENSSSVTLSDITLIKLLPDYVTVQKFGSVTIDILANDIIQLHGFFNNLSSLKDSIEIQLTMGGEIYSTGSGNTSKLIYVNNGLPKHSDGYSNIDSFKYSFNVIRPNMPLEKYSAWVYIYIIEDLNSAATCAPDGSTYTTNLTNYWSLEGGTFEWKINGGAPYSALNSTITLTTPLNISIKPIVPGFSFPEGQYDLKRITNGTTMRWTGHVDKDWNNINNWVEITTDGNRQIETAVDHPPVNCTDVIISSNIDNYPELEDGLNYYCRNIQMKDRAMLKNPHALNYDSVSVEIKLKPSERDRFLMWSAPLKGMVSGDYFYRHNGDTVRGDVFMNFFQKANPDHSGSSAMANHFTATFGSLNTPIPLGTAFNLKVTSTSITGDGTMSFTHKSGRHRFITDDLVFLCKDCATSTPNETVYELNVSNTVNGDRIVQAVNPYMAYLGDMFFVANNNNGGFNGYYIWNGDMGSGFTAVLLNSGNRIVVADNLSMDYSYGQIPPLQSFFVLKGSQFAGKLKISPQWTNTTESRSYTLRSDNKANSSGVLTLKLSHEGKSAYAVLSHENGATGFMDKGDMPVLIYDELPLSVYTFAYSGESLQINSSGTFDMNDLPLGIRVREGGEMRLDFSGLETFGYDVTLIDKQLNRRIDLQQTPGYTFTVNKSSTVQEINDRFALSMIFTGKGLNTGSERVNPTAPLLRVSSANGYINAISDGTISSLRIYTPSGSLFYQTADLKGNSFSIKATKNQFYILQAVINGKLTVEKVLVR